MDEKQKQDALEIGNRLLLLRNYHNLSQAEFAKRVSTSPQFISDWECGKRILSMKVALNISREFNVSLSHFNPDESSVIKIDELPKS